MRVFKISRFLQVLLLCIGTPLNSKYVNEERLVAAVGTRAKLKLLQTWCSIIYKWCSLLMAKLETVSKKITDLLIECNCNTKIINVVFDTTGSNTGHLTVLSRCYSPKHFTMVRISTSCWRSFSNLHFHRFERARLLQDLHQFLQ